MPSISARYYDGITSRRQAVEVSLHPEGLAIFSGEGFVVARWPYAAIRRIEGFRGNGLAITRVPEPGSSAEPRLEVDDPAFAADRYAPGEVCTLRRTDPHELRRRRRHLLVQGGQDQDRRYRRAGNFLTALRG